MKCETCAHFEVCAYFSHQLPFCTSYLMVVRCGECKHFHNRTCKIRKGSWGEQLKVGYTDFCSDGERKDGEG